MGSSNLPSPTYSSRTNFALASNESDLLCDRLHQQVKSDGNDDRTFEELKNIEHQRRAILLRVRLHCL